MESWVRCLLVEQYTAGTDCGEKPASTPSYTVYFFAHFMLAAVLSKDTLKHIEIWSHSFIRELV